MTATPAVLSVVCINWCNYLGRGEEYVSRLRRAVARNLTKPHEFVCLTEKELGTDLKGWWVKMLLTQPGRFVGPVMYLDLDVTITRNIDHIVDLAATDKTKLWARDDFSYSYRKPKALDAAAMRLLGGRGCINSSVMLWDSDALAPIWEQWQKHSAKFMAEAHGDQNVISSIMCPSDRIGYLPDDSVQSFKYGILRNRERPGPIVVFHGQPKISDLPPSHEVRRIWETA
jgi:hypothetical protein